MTMIEIKLRWIIYKEDRVWVVPGLQDGTVLIVDLKKDLGPHTMFRFRRYMNDNPEIELENSGYVFYTLEAAALAAEQVYFADREGNDV